MEQEEGTEATAMEQAKAPLHPLEEEEVHHQRTHELSQQTESIHLMFTRSGTIGTCADLANTMCPTGTIANPSLCHVVTLHTMKESPRKMRSHIVMQATELAWRQCTGLTYH